MAMWTSNQLNITGPKKDVDRFQELGVTKWDACHVFVERKSDTELVCTFETANGASEPVFMGTVRLFPELSFDYRFVGEEGWGGEYHADGGLYWIVSEWDDPKTHEDRMENIGYCHCEEYGEHDDPDYLYDDCPKKMELEASK